MQGNLRAPSRRLAAIAPAIVLVVQACGGGIASPPSGSGGAIATSAPNGTAAGGPATPGTSGVPAPAETPQPLGDRLIATITVAANPCALAVDKTAAWATSNSTGALDRIDPTTNRVTDSTVVGKGLCGIAVGSDGRVWIADLGAGSVLAVDPATRKVTARIDDVGPALWDLKGGFGSIWVADRNAKAVLRIDPAKAKITARIPVGPQPSGLAVVSHGVWVSDDTDSKLRRIDPATNKVAATIMAGGAPTWFADDGATHLAVAERGAGKVIAIDLAKDALEDPIPGWNQPLDGTVFQGRAWIPEGSTGRVGVFDVDATSAPEVVRYALPGAANPFVAEPAFGDIWILDFGKTTIWRIRATP